MTVKLPRVADTSDEVVVESVLVQVDDQVEVGQPLLSVETEKAMVEVPSPVAGRVLEILVRTDDELTTGMAIVVLESVQ